MTDEATDLPRHLQLLWGREPAGRRGPRPGRSLGEIAAAGIAIADAEGLDAVSLKRVAEAVGFTTMSLYRYVDGKEDLLGVMLDAAVGPPDLAPPDGWREGLAAWARGIAARRLAHPWTVEVVQSAPPLTPNMLAWTEAGLAALADTPLTAQERFSVLLAVDGWGHQHVRQSIQLGLVGPGAGSEADDYPARIVELVHPERHPYLTAAGPEALADGDDDFFADELERGLGLLLDGTEALVSRRRAARRSAGRAAGRAAGR